MAMQTITTAADAEFFRLAGIVRCEIEADVAERHSRIWKRRVAQLEAERLAAGRRARRAFAIAGASVGLALGAMFILFMSFPRF